MVVIAALTGRAGAGKQRHLMGRAVSRWIGPENILRAVAVMHVEIGRSRRGRCVFALRGRARLRHVEEQKPIGLLISA